MNIGRIVREVEAKPQQQPDVPALENQQQPDVPALEKEIATLTDRPQQETSVRA
jgi:hypothetical protein